MSAYIELEIQHRLNDTMSLEDVAQALIQDLESSSENWTAENIQGLARFLLRSGLYIPLIQFVRRHLEEEDFAIPWPYFLEALALASPQMDPRMAQSLLEGLQDTGNLEEASRSTALDSYEPLIADWRRDRLYKIHKDYHNNKKNLLDQLITLRTQQLYEKEKSLLSLLQKLYPGDVEVKKEADDHRQRYALDILARRSPSLRRIPVQDLLPKDPEVEKALRIFCKALLISAKEDPTLIKDLAVAAFMVDSFETALEIIDLAPIEEEALAWLRLEALLGCRRFIELLTELTNMEMALSHEPETFFATAYLRAQAFWGLGQKHNAIEVLEGLLASRPHYRAASSLLTLWSGQ